ncbi:tRNA pseudouridine(55) synthase TruB [Arenivirga flava]|uniref:tRNA pseudouridine(55) synthase TruB n=1 Tax=Arenivirga flava TaxID=1930060 RepID=UPI0024E12918|nr:tRNA pseudouridine(55) synthase TruB [Arenivirga flava]
MNEGPAQQQHQRPRAGSGILLLDKPQGLTSHDAVARTRRLAGTRKVGHAGTLDPMATGLLVLGLNSSTRLLTYLVGLDKEYTATIRLGASTVTDDAEGEITGTAETAHLADEAVEAAIAPLRGDIEQVPSTVSAIKVDGKRAYARAREGEDVQLSARPVRIDAFEVLASRRVDGFLDLDVRVVCTSGTYIRALARDLGAALGVGGHLTALRRTRVGPFAVAHAPELADDLDVGARMLRPADVAGALFPTVRLDADDALALSQGKRIRPDGLPEATGPLAVLTPTGDLLGLAARRGDGLRTLVNFPADEVAAP